MAYTDERCPRPQRDEKSGQLYGGGGNVNDLRVTDLIGVIKFAELAS